MCQSTIFKMKSYKFCVVVLVCVVLTASPNLSLEIDEDQEINAINAGAQAAAAVAAMCVATPPMGPILLASLGLMHVASMIMTGGGDDEESKNALTKLDLIKSQSMILDAVNNLGGKLMDQSEKVLRELKYVIQKTPMMEGMRLDLGFMERANVDKLKTLMDPKKTGVQKNATIANLLDNDSSFMERLRAFIDRYIKPKVILASADDIKLFYELTLESDRLLALENKDNYPDSTSNRIFKSYMYITKTLTEAYVLPMVAHALQYQSEIKRGLISDAQSTKSNADDLIEYYKNDMKALVEKTKWALNNAPREIRNSPIFKLEKGVTFERLSFAQSIPRIFYPSTYGCNEEPSLLNLKQYEVGKQCNSHEDIIPLQSQVSIYYNPKDLERPYQYMKVVTPQGDEEEFGHNSSDPNLLKYQFTVQGMCPFSMCPIYKKSALAISTQRISADRGNVITGLRFRVKDNVIYIDIQQGKFIDILSADPKVSWKTTPAGGPVQYLSSSANKLELGDFEVEDDTFLTSIQIQPKRGRYNSMRFEIRTGGSKAPDWNDFSSFNARTVPDANELRVPEADDAEKANVDEKNLISPPPVENEGYFISIQPTDIKKDLGRSTYPLIDIRPVVSSPPAPLRGFGIYHTKVGFLSLKLITPKLDHLADTKLNDALVQSKAI